jgi:3-deoxy-D-manno-octulosonic-acid transferase
MRRWLFNLGYLSLTALIWPWFVYKYATTGKYRAGIRQRLGGLPARESRRSIWVHAVSVGELLQIRPLLKALRERHPQYDVVVTYTTKTAAEIAARELPDYYHCYSPLDLSWIVAKFFRVLNPALIVLVELELWPNWLMHARRKGVPVLLANGRISEHSFRNYRRFKWLLQPAYDAISTWAMQDEAYEERARALVGTGARSASDGLARDRVRTVGNLKYDSLASEADPEKVRYFRQAFAISENQRVLVCGSTHPGEHEMIVETLPRLACRVVIVPRHPERYDSVREMLTRAGIPWRNRSELSPNNPAASNDVILLNTVGELSSVYGIADVVFVGGSLIPHGGQNMMEPVAYGKATLFGPHTHNFKATVRELKEAGGATEVQNAVELEAEIKRLLNDDAACIALGQAGQKRLLASRGALARHLKLIEELLNEAEADKAS